MGLRVIAPADASKLRKYGYDKAHCTLDGVNDDRTLQDLGIAVGNDLPMPDRCSRDRGKVQVSDTRALGWAGLKEDLWVRRRVICWREAGQQNGHKIRVLYMQ